MQPLPGGRHHEGRDRARASGGQANAESIIRLLNDALVTKLVCILRYKRHYFMTAGINCRHVKAKFLQHVTEERTHTDQ